MTKTFTKEERYSLIDQINKETKGDKLTKSEEVGRLLNDIIQNPEKYMNK